MAEIKISTTQLEDSLGALHDAVGRAFTESEQAGGLYRPDTVDVPRPNFQLFELQEGLALQRGRYELTPHDGEKLRGFAGLRGIAKTRVQANGSVQIISGPAIVLPGAQRVSMLVGEKAADTITDMQHALLDSEYAKQHAKVSPEHSSRDAKNAAEIGAALMVASTVGLANAHHDMHSLAGGEGSFGVNFSNAERQDVQVGHEVRRVRSAVLPLSRLVFYTSEADQLPPDAAPLGASLTAGELAVGMTLAATNSRGNQPNLVANFHAMVGE